jgi:hypothetical protein
VIFKETERVHDKKSNQGIGKSRCLESETESLYLSVSYKCLSDEDQLSQGPLKKY